MGHVPSALPPDFATRRLPYASGWYFLCPAEAIAAERVRVHRLCGRDLALWRTASGRLRAAWNACPHLGGRLGEGGRVEGEALVCGLHRRRFGVDGAALGGDAERCLSMVPVREQGGLALAWFGAGGEAPSWEVPAADMAGWSPLAFTSRDLATHPQHVMQDLADVEHFTSVHGYEDVAVTRPLALEGPRIGFSAAIVRPASALSPKLRLAFDSEVHGLGYQLTEVTGPGGVVRTRHFVMPTPLDAGTTRVSLGLSVRFEGALGRAVGALGALGRAAADRALGAFAMNAFRRDVGLDARLWVSRYHLDDVLPAPDEDVARFRAWARQFYPAAT